MTDKQKDLMVIKARDLVVRQRTQIVNTVRGLLRSGGYKLIEAEFSAETIKKGTSINIFLTEIPFILV